jgi:predicted SAM-dependent methyltransferase
MPNHNFASILLHTSARSAWERLLRLWWTLRRRRQIENYLATNTIRKLQIGAGLQTFNDWLNTDFSPQVPQIVFMDIRTPFPLPDNSFDYIFAEHVIEHVSYEAGCAMLKESLRVLRTGGRIRIATPDLQVLLSLNATDHSEMQLRYMRWITANFLPHVETPKAVFVINNAFQNWGHQFLYDSQSLASLLQQTGFVDITQCESGHSTDAVLTGIDSRAYSIADKEMNRFESMVLEARKRAG